MKTDTPRTDAVIQSPNSYFMVRVENLCRELERELYASKAEVERLQAAFSRLADEIECTPWCNSHQAGFCDCGRLERAYAISDSIPQNQTNK